MLRDWDNSIVSQWNRNKWNCTVRFYICYYKDKFMKLTLEEKRTQNGFAYFSCEKVIYL